MRIRRIVRPLFAYLVATAMGLALAIVLVPAPAFADEAAVQRVEELKKRGNQAMLDLNYGEALDAYTAAIAIAPDEATLYYNLGRAHQAREDYPAALDALDQFAHKASPDVKARVPKLDQLIADVRSRVGTLSIQCSAEVTDATVSVVDKTTLRGCSTAPRSCASACPPAPRSSRCGSRPSATRARARGSRSKAAGRR